MEAYGVIDSCSLIFSFGIAMTLFVTGLLCGVFIGKCIADALDDDSRGMMERM